MTDTYIPDISEFQSVTHLPEAAIVRAHNGWRADHKWPAFAEIAKRDCRWWGAYQYLPASVDPAKAARAFAATLGAYRPNVVILDLEEGSGNQAARLRAWHDAIDWPTEWDYSGLYFARSRGISDQVEWIAAYQRTEPTDKHLLWQFTNRRTFPGIAAPCDGSVFHGTVDDLIRLTTPDFVTRGTSAPIPVPAPAPEPQEDDLPTAQEIAAAILAAPVGGTATDSPHTLATAIYREQSEAMRASDQLENLAELQYAIFTNNRTAADAAIAKVRSRAHGAG